MKRSRPGDRHLITPFAHVTHGDMETVRKRLQSTLAFTRLRGRSFPLGKVTQPVISQVSIELEDEGKSNATINRVVSAVSTVLNHCAFDGLIPSAPKPQAQEGG